MGKSSTITEKSKHSHSTFILYGVVFWVPVALVFYVIFFLFSNAEKIGRGILGLVVPDNWLFFGLGAIFCLAIIYCTGLVLKLTKLGKVLSKIPFIGLFFGQGEIMTIGRLANMQPCLFLYSPTCLSYGWILSEEKVKMSRQKALFPIINIYYPNVPTLITGQVYAARKDTVMKLANSSREVIDLLLYAFRSPAALEYIPWEDESQDNFQERSKYFGLKLDTGKNPELDATDMGTSPP
ncbi:hypothetical protein DEALK_02490 [Dehalogenimonas alkenigignens]|uniref:Uncharacterized protein n=1 Tax=Dehalogenimonas alkenigignens TaxID=1217799 RepID=A0A0W0GLC2_9CHLR|nr:hypothetical protein [Dehalogenimonas alkenigignens]KTB49336.1 hypothetical protein DEALK_02490 [Dehalogenimonas alkenigignens]